MAGKVKVIQLKSASKSSKKQKGTLAGLGLKKIGSQSVLEDSKAVRGMIVKVAHLVKVEQA